MEKYGADVKELQRTELAQLRRRLIDITESSTKTASTEIAQLQQRERDLEFALAAGDQ